MRKAILIVSIAASAMLAPAGRAQDNTAQALQTEAERVLAAEDEYVAAEVSRDEATLQRLVDDRFLFNRSDGRTTGKEELIRSVMNMNMVGQTISERSVLVEHDIALIFGTAALEFPQPDGEVSVSRLRYTATYVNRHGQWRMLALQMQQRSPE